jgi:hypothetical protein
MAFKIEDRRKKATPKIGNLIKNKVVTKEQVLDWLRSHL